MSELVNIEHIGKIAVVRLQRANRENRLNSDMFDGLRKAALKLSDAPPAAIVLTGTSEVFCAGLDLGPDNPTIARIHQLARAKDTYALAELIRGLRARLDLLSRVTCPTIAAIEGPCVGAGLQLALSCDLRVAASTAHFAMPETGFGALPFLGGLIRLSRLAGYGRAKDMVLTGRSANASTLESWGVVNRIAPTGEALAVALELADEVANKSPLATKNALLALRQLEDLGTEIFEVECETGARTLSSGQFSEAVLALLQDSHSN